MCRSSCRNLKTCSKIARRNSECRPGALMTKPAWISMCVATMLAFALRLNSHPATLHNPAQAPTLDPCVSHLESPKYPPLARQTRIQGRATVSVSVYRDGTASVGKEGKGNALLFGSAQENLKTWRFKPNDSPEAIPLDVEYEFVLDTDHPTDDFNAASTVTLDLPRHVRISAPARKPIIDVVEVKKRHWWQFWK